MTAGTVSGWKGWGDRVVARSGWKGVGYRMQAASRDRVSRREVGIDIAATTPRPIAPRPRRDATPEPWRNLHLSLSPGATLTLLVGIRLAAAMGRNLAALAQFRNPGEIQRVEEDGGVTYRRVMLLAPGTWTDAGSRQTILYAGDAIRKSAENWSDRTINLLHGPAFHNATVLDDVGEILEDSIIVDDDDRMFGDLHCHGDSSASELAIDLMDEVLEAAGDPTEETPPVGPSVEIVDDTTEIDEQRGLERMVEMEYGGLGLVFNPASKPAVMENQVRERAVAMADEHGADVDADVYLLEDDVQDLPAECRECEENRRMQGTYRCPECHPDVDPEDFDGELAGEGTQTLKSGSRRRLSMGERKEIFRTLEDITSSLKELERSLQNGEEMAAVQDAIAQYQQDGNDLAEATVEEFIQWADGNTDVGTDVLQDVVDAFMESVEAGDPGAASAEALNDWLAETGGSEEGGDGGDGEGEEEEEAQETMGSQELEEAINTIGKFSDKMEQLDEMLTEYIEETEEQMDDLDRRLSEIEDEPQQRSLAGDQGGDDFVDVDDDSGSSSATEHEDVMM